MTKNIEILNNRLTSGELISNDVQVVVLGSSQLGLKDATIGGGGGGAEWWG